MTDDGMAHEFAEHGVWHRDRYYRVFLAHKEEKHGKVKEAQSDDYDKDKDKDAQRSRGHRLTGY